MTNCSPASSRLRFCAGIMRRRAGRGSSAEGLLRAKIVAALPYALTPSQERAVTDIIADLAQPNRMLRLLHGDVGSGKTLVALLVRRDRDRSRPAGGVHGADGNSGAAAFRHHRAACGGGRHPRRATHRARARTRTAGDSGKARRRRDRSHRRHACALSRRRGVPRSGAGNRRRAASLRRAPAARACPQRRGGRSARAHGDADSAHAGAHLFRRHGRLGAARKAGRAAADRHARAAAGPACRK